MLLPKIFEMIFMILESVDRPEQCHRKTMLIQMVHDLWFDFKNRTNFKNAQDVTALPFIGRSNAVCHLLSERF